jgi:hypothetical protein
MALKTINNYADAIISFSSVNDMICLCFFNFMANNVSVWVIVRRKGERHVFLNKQEIDMYAYVDMNNNLLLKK